MIVSDDFLPTFNRPNVHLVTGAIQRITPDGIVTKPEKQPERRPGNGGDGDEKGEVARKLDVLVYATGYDVVASVDELGVVGKGGVSLRAAFAAKGGPEAYLGMTTPGFPNLFFLMGPNTGLGHSSMIAMIEAQARYAAEAIATAGAKGWASLEVKAPDCEAYNKRLQAELSRNVWTGCVSWYNLQGAKNVSLWPFTVWAYHRAMRKVDWGHYTLEKA